MPPAWLAPISCSGRPSTQRRQPDADVTQRGAEIRCSGSTRANAETGRAGPPHACGRADDPCRLSDRRSSRATRSRHAWGRARWASSTRRATRNSTGSWPSRRSAAISGWPSDEFAVYKQRFFQEAKAAGRLNHPNVVAIYDVMEVEQTPYIVMEYVESDTLATLIKAQGALPPDRAVEIARHVCLALEHAHAHGVVHRDIKPANILFGNTRRGEGRRFRHRAHRRPGPHPDGSLPRHAVLHVAGTDPRSGRGRAQRPLLARRRPVRGPDRGETVLRPGRDQRDPQHRARRAGAAPRAEPAGAPGAQRGRGTGARQGSGAALSDARAPSRMRSAPPPQRAGPIPRP